MGEAFPRHAVGTGARPRYSLELLVAVSAGVFSERGYDGTSMADLSRATGLAKSALYHYVESKEQLLRLALERAVVPLLALAEEAGGSPGPAITRLECLITSQVQLLVRELPYVALLLRVRGNTGTECWALERRRAFDRCVADLVREAVADGDLPDSGDPALVSRLVSGMINSMSEWHRPEPGGVPVEEGRLVRTVVSMVFDGLRATPSGQVPGGRTSAP